MARATAGDTGTGSPLYDPGAALHDPADAALASAFRWMGFGFLCLISLPLLWDPDVESTLALVPDFIAFGLLAVAAFRLSRWGAVGRWIGPVAVLFGILALIISLGHLTEIIRYLDMGVIDTRDGTTVAPFDLFLWILSSAGAILVLWLLSSALIRFGVRKEESGLVRTVRWSRVVYLIVVVLPILLVIITASTNMRGGLYDWAGLAMIIQAATVLAIGFLAQSAFQAGHLARKEAERHVPVAPPVLDRADPGFTTRPFR